MLKQMMILIGLSLVGGGMTFWLHGKRPVFSVEQLEQQKVEGQVTLSEVESRWGFAGVIWIDARSAKSYRSGHISKAVHLENLNGFADLDPEVTTAMFEADVPKVVYCGYEDCKASTKLARALEDQGFTNVHVLQGGYSRWKMRKK